MTQIIDKILKINFTIFAILTSSSMIFVVHSWSLTYSEYKMLKITKNSNIPIDFLS